MKYDFPYQFFIYERSWWETDWDDWLVSTNRWIKLIQRKFKIKLWSCPSIEWSGDIDFVLFVWKFVFFFILTVRDIVFSYHTNDSLSNIKVSELVLKITVAYMDIHVVFHKHIFFHCALSYLFLHACTKTDLSESTLQFVLRKYLICYSISRLKYSRKSYDACQIIRDGRVTIHIILV